MFGTSGIRGTVGESVTGELALQVGRALASEGADRVLVGRDVREHGDPLVDALATGARECGASVVDVGVAATPTVARAAAWYDCDAGVAVTASHNPPADNGLKLWNPNGPAFDEDQRAAVSERVRADDYDLVSWRDVGDRTRESDATQRHVEALVAATSPLDADLTVAVDVGNGTGSITADALHELGCDVRTLDAQADGRFPARPSEPTAATCRHLREFVAATDADLGVAHDGDADRTMAVAGDGSFVPGDDLLGLFAAREASADDRVAAPLNTSLAVDDRLAERGATLERTRVGDVFVAQRTTDPDVVFGGEPSGAWIWPDETLCPDGPLAACRLVELVADRGPLADLVERATSYPLRRESVAVDEKAAVMDAVVDRLVDRYDSVDTRDGARVTLDDGWFLVRPSGTEPVVRLTAEARQAARAEELLAVGDAVVEESHAASR
jgi:phosphoglucosamine mutase